MNITSFEKHHVAEAMSIAYSNYLEERQFVSKLPHMNSIPTLYDFAENGLGVAAFDNKMLIGFLCCYRPWENAFNSTAIGTFSPIHAHGAISKNRDIIYKKLYQVAAEKWVAHKITYHAIALYAHDKQSLDAFIMYGFGVRCVDAIRPMNRVDYQHQDDLILKELLKEDIAQIREMRKMLSEHLGNSPCFMRSTPQDFQNRIKRVENRNSKVYVAVKNQKPVAFIEITNDGENFITEVEGIKNICGAFCLPEYRGTGVFQNLLNYSITRLKAEGFQNLGVDFESFNPTASGFWNKYFIPYTHSVVRRIDECALID